jgi:hypothetical protein
MNEKVSTATRKDRLTVDEEDAIRGRVMVALVDSKMEFTLEDEALLFPFFAAGMESHGPIVETVTMPVAGFVQVLRAAQAILQAEIDARAAAELAHTDAHFETIKAEKQRDELAARLSGIVAVPEGWKLVPTKMTIEMAIAFAEVWFTQIRCIDDPEMDDAYAALIGAAPEPPHG